MIVAALDARFAVSFTTGLLAAVNPCGFVLLPTYLMYFLGMENLRPGGTERASLRRALLVSLAVSAGFLLVFAVIGAITKWSTDWFADKAPWISLAIGLALVVLGIAMLFGFRLPFTTPKLDVGGRDRTVRSMFVFGIAYAVASIGCTLPTFSANVLGAVTVEGIRRGLLAFFWYSLGMALIVTGLTVTLAMANVAMLRVLRRSLGVFEYVAGIFVLLTGLYLSWYWYHGITQDVPDDRIIDRANSWQDSLRAFIERNQTTIVTLSVVVIAAAIVLAYVLHRRPSEVARS
ncbi:MAG: cytochrome c biogenesis CcdA family protein [Ilumatobacteraceae bacterium]